MPSGQDAFPLLSESTVSFSSASEIMGVSPIPIAISGSQGAWVGKSSTTILVIVSASCATLGMGGFSRYIAILHLFPQTSATISWIRYLNFSFLLLLIDQYSAFFATLYSAHLRIMSIPFFLALVAFL